MNVVIATYKDDLLGEVQVYPERGTVGFGSGLHGWGTKLHYTHAITSLNSLARCMALLMLTTFPSALSLVSRLHYSKGKNLASVHTIL